jgi:hypothetical protein
MPIILRIRNLSTDLGISNGSQGYLKKLVTECLKDGTMVPKAAIVHFPLSKVKLNGSVAAGPVKTHEPATQPIDELT